MNRDLILLGILQQGAPKANLSEFAQEVGFTADDATLLREFAQEIGFVPKDDAAWLREFAQEIGFTEV